MKFRFLVAALAVIVGGAAIFGGRATTTQAAAGGTITLKCPAIVLQGASFSCDVGLGAMPDPVFGYQFVLIYDSPVGPSGTPVGTGTRFTATSIVNNYVATAFWGAGELCPADAMNVANPLLPTGYMGSGHGCAALGGTGAVPAAVASLVSFNFTANGLGSAAPIHMVTLAGGGVPFGSYTVDGTASAHVNTYVCVPSVPANCAPTPFSAVDNPADPVVTTVLPPPDVEVVKTASVASIVQGQPMSFTLTATNLSTTSPAPGVVITDTFNAAFTLGVMPAGCSASAQVVTCTVGTLAPSGTASYVIPVTVTGGAGTTVTNCASESNSSVPADPNPANNSCPSTGSNQVSVQIIPPAVAWSKSPANQQVFLCEAGTVGLQGCTTDGKNGTVSFDEILTNQGDPNGLGAFEFTLHFNNLIFNVPTICGGPTACPAQPASVVDLSAAYALFSAAGRTLTCSMSLPLETQIRVACASTGPIGVGPTFIGAQTMATVHMQIKDFVRGSLYPHKENGIVTRFDDTGTELANTCGWPLNDGTGFVLPGQTTECQGVALLGILPGGLVADSTAFVTVRRLEGDVTKDCSVTVADMQAEATRYGFSFGSLLYQIWYDLEPHVTGADGDIDIKDVQFVFGRFGSECTAPIPPQVAQLPVDP